MITQTMGMDDKMRYISILHNINYSTFIANYCIRSILHNCRYNCL
jgi:hypothetical protein